MKVNFNKYRSKLSFPSADFVVLTFATALSALFFSLWLQVESYNIALRGKLADESEVIALPYSDSHTTIPKITPQLIAIQDQLPQVASETEVWGVAEQISETTWTMKVGEDEKMATPQEIQSALNAYRNKKGVGSLEWDDKLAEFALQRAQTFSENQTLDEHEGFKEYVQHDNNMENLGFWGVGENSSFGFRMEGVHLIEWIFAGDPPHDNNQLDPEWTHVGIGVVGTAVDVIFGKK